MAVYLRHSIILALELIIKSIKSPKSKKESLNLTAIVKSIEFFGINGTAVRGHRNDGALNSSNILKKSGNLRSLINFRIDARDKILENRLNSCSKTATYISKATQNELLLCIKDQL